MIHVRGCCGADSKPSASGTVRVPPVIQGMASFAHATRVSQPHLPTARASCETPKRHLRPSLRGTGCAPHPSLPSLSYYGVLLRSYRVSWNRLVQTLVNAYLAFEAWFQHPCAFASIISGACPEVHALDGYVKVATGQVSLERFRLARK